MTWGAVGGAAIGAGASLIGGSKDSPDLQPWARVGEGMKRNYFPAVNQFADQYGPESLYSGSRLADENQQVAAGQKRALLLNPMWAEQAQRNANAIEGFIDYDPNSPVNQARRDSFSAQAMDNFNTNVRPAIEDRGTFSGQFGGPQQALAMGRAAGDTMRDINMFEANMMEADRQRALQATGMAPSIFAAQNAPFLMREQIGQRKTARDQLELEDQIQRQEAGYNNALRANLDMASLYNPFSGLGYQGTVSSGPNPIQGALSGAVLGNQLFPNMSNPFSGLFGGGTTPPFNPAAGSGSFMPTLDTSVITQGFS